MGIGCSLGTASSRRHLLAGLSPAGIVPAQAFAGATDAEAAVDGAVRQFLASAPQAAGLFAVGLNWQMMIDGARRRIWQDGTLPGFAAMCAMLPHSGAGLVALANQLDRDSMQAFQRMSQAILIGLDPGSADLL